ncbi:hypothetical protein MTR_7g027170 [Medicago truncatula]|uniref:Reverse transcriptase zinc-binding domain-containing protein n=1 Tax=Medicago truncatula TaxID=3880 RepID=G7L161_MEDTR|nr:hypothetical protein MTR_7g027170 [Medicago truncatula]
MAYDIMSSPLGTLFWFDRWVGEVPLQLGWDEGGEAWKWRRGLRAWEEEQLVECTLLLLIVVLQVNINDVLYWIPDLVASYTVRGVYHSLLAEFATMPSATSASAPSIWSAYEGQFISEKDYSGRCSVCVSGCGNIESADQLFLHCEVFGQVWQLVHLWLGVSSVNPLTISAHYLQINISSGLLLAKYMGILDFVCYSDALHCINILNGPPNEGNVMVNHTLREENQCADFFAKLRASSDVEFLRHESPLMNLKNLLQNDVAEIFLSVLALYNKKLAHIK